MSFLSWAAVYKNFGGNRKYSVFGTLPYEWVAAAVGSA